MDGIFKTKLYTVILLRRVLQISWLTIWTGGRGVSLYFFSKKISFSIFTCTCIYNKIKCPSQLIDLFIFVNVCKLDKIQVAIRPWWKREFLWRQNLIVMQFLHIYIRINYPACFSVKSDAYKWMGLGFAFVSCNYRVLLCALFVNKQGFPCYTSLKFLWFRM